MDDVDNYDFDNKLMMIIVIMIVMLNEVHEGDYNH